MWRTSAAAKLTIGAACQATSWLCFALSAARSDAALGLDDENHKGSLLWPVVANLFYTISHLHVGPVGLSLATRCAPPGAQSSAVGIWFLFGGVGGPLAGSLGAFYSVWTPSAFFAVVAGIALANAASPVRAGANARRIARGHG